MPRHEAVRASFSCVTEPHLTLGAVPRGENASFLVVVTHGTVYPFVFSILGRITFRDGCWKMSARKGPYNSTTTTSSFPAAVVSYQLTCQLETKVLDSAERCVITVAFLEYERIC